MSKVTVVADENGNVVYKSENNKEFGHIRVEQTVSIIENNGWLSRKKLIALIPGKVEDLESLDYVHGQEIAGKIVVKESLTPFNPKNPEKDLKYAGNTGILCKSGNSPIYRKCIYTMDMTQSDEFIAHTNSDEIKKEFKKSAIKPNEEFSL